MSRTYKDEPKYVKLRKEKFHFTWSHRIRAAGLKGYTSVLLLDENGNYQTELHTYTAYVSGEYTSGDLVYEYGYEIEKQYLRIKRGRKLVRSFKDHCTCGEEPIRTTSKLDRNPCTKNFTKAAKVKRYPSQYKKENHEGDKRRTKQKMKNMTKFFNATNDSDVLNEDTFQTIYAFKAPLLWNN